MLLGHFGPEGQREPCTGRAGLQASIEMGLSCMLL